MICIREMKFLACLVAGIVLAGPTLTLADPRPWTFTTDLYREGKGNFEFEQWVTWKHHKESEPGFDRVDIREEIEFGATEWLDIGLYLPKWRYEDSNSRKGVTFDVVGVEFIAYLSKPTDCIGFGLYNEISAGENKIELEQKLLFQKDIGNWSLGYNLILETEIEREESDGHTENEVEGVLGHAFAVSYRLGKKWRVGAEVLVESVYKDWTHYEGTTVWAGPSINYIGGNIGGTSAQWWVTVSPSFQVTDQEGEPDFVLRMIAGIEF